MSVETDGQRIIRFIETFCRVPEGPKGKVGKPIRLLPFQKEFISAVYDNPAGTSRGYLSIARKNGKTGLIACLALAHIAGPMKIRNSQIISGARSRDQASLVFNLAEKIINFSPELRKVIRTTSSKRMLTGLVANVEFRAISAEAGTAHGLSPVVAILDEVGQIKGPVDPFVEAIDTAQGAYDNALLLAISTQAASEADMFSLWLDAAETTGSPHIVSRLYTAPEDCDILDRKAWESANPALGEFRSAIELERKANEAHEMPSAENSFRWLYLNQRVDASSPFVPKSVWKACGGAVVPDFSGHPVFCGLDLSMVSDLTAFVAIAPINGVWHVRPTFWLPEQGLREKAYRDRAPYLDWVRDGYLTATPGATIGFEFVAEFLRGFCSCNDVRKIAFDPWRYEFLKPYLLEKGFTSSQLEGDSAIFVPMIQGFKSYTPALQALEADLINVKLAHGNNPALGNCAANATVVYDEIGNRKLSKKKSHGRIDGMIALTMARSVAGTFEAPSSIDISSLIV